ncbi:hypothetical protein PLICRDRAFT_175691 [Plicaturopsis crispa FD-325 SS-3]|nr:hypothetical protein PLICRDRAFT_175691 [Plicaturopsis crispa FD-325 SS-3]
MPPDSPPDLPQQQQRRQREREEIPQPTDFAEKMIALPPFRLPPQLTRSDGRSDADVSPPRLQAPAIDLLGERERRYGAQDAGDGEWATAGSESPRKVGRRAALLGSCRNRTTVRAPAALRPSKTR